MRRGARLALDDLQARALGGLLDHRDLVAVAVERGERALDIAERAASVSTSRCLMTKLAGAAPKSARSREAQPVELVQRLDEARRSAPP